MRIFFAFLFVPLILLLITSSSYAYIPVSVNFDSFLSRHASTRKCHSIGKIIPGHKYVEKTPKLSRESCTRLKLRKDFSRDSLHRTSTALFTGDKEKDGYGFRNITKNLLKKVTKKGDNKHEVEELARLIDSKVKKQANELSKSSRWVESKVKEKIAKKLNQKGGHGAGDLSRLIDSKVRDKVADLNEKEEDEIENLRRKVESKVKEKMSRMNQKGEYEVGYLSRLIDSKLKEKIARLSQKEDYEVGDLSRLIDTRVKEKIAKLNQKDKYEVGDLSSLIDSTIKEQAKEISRSSQWVDSKVKEKIAKLNQKDKYEVGDLSSLIDSTIKEQAKEISRSSQWVDSKVKEKIAKLNQKDNYEAGDFARLIDSTIKEQANELSKTSQWVDSKVKEKVAELNQKEDYEAGDLSRLIDSKVKEQANKFTSSSNYKFGDVSKEIVRRVITHDYTPDDLIILFKILISFGVGLSPVANFLPAKLLIELLDLSIAGEVTNRVAAAIALELDKRFKKAFTDDPNYQMGDLTKNAVLKYIEKDTYDFGDVTKFVLKNTTGMSANSGIGSSDTGEFSVRGSLLSDTDGYRGLLVKELEEWDKKFLLQLNNEDDRPNIGGSDEKWDLLATTNALKASADSINFKDGSESGFRANNVYSEFNEKELKEWDMKLLEHLNGQHETGDNHSIDL